MATGASTNGTLECVDAWVENFRPNIERIAVPTLAIHGDAADRILPIEATGRRLANEIKDVKFVEPQGGPAQFSGATRTR